MNADEIVNRLREYAKHCDGVHSCWNDTTLISAADLIESLQAQLAESQRMADAAVEDITHDCETCLHSEASMNEPPCLDCDYFDELRDRWRSANWVWRGAK